MEVNPKHATLCDAIEPRATAAVALMVISPHLDDGVLACADLLLASPAAAVVTVFAGRPDCYHELTNWDSRCGFHAIDDVVMCRRREDSKAVHALGARPLWLDFVDPQYGEPPFGDAVKEQLAHVLAQLEPAVVAIPLGLLHDDHRIVSDAAIELCAGDSHRVWLCYADAIYRQVSSVADDRIEQLQRYGFALHRVDDDLSHPASGAKRRAIACYASQIKGLEQAWPDGVSDAFRPEQYWRVVPSNDHRAAVAP